MDQKNRPVSRKKKVGTGSVRVEKRGTGVGRGPVGGSGGFFNQKPKTSSSSSISPSSNSRPSGSRRSSGGLGKLIMLVLFGLVAYYFISKTGLSNLGGSTGDSLLGNLTGENTMAANATFDKGAYAVDRSISEQSRPKFTTLVGNGNDQVTIMVYLLGTDLESRSGMATKDLQEMLDADLSDNINIVVETGGTSKWKNETISTKTNQRYLINAAGMQVLDDDLGKKSMVDPNTLTDFICYSEDAFPADRYFLILWDHGGGSITGYGYDEYFKGDNMTIDEIGSALENAGCQFDLVGFDACLMATLETAFVVEPYADYMIASEEVEPGIGWFYTGWLNELSENSSIETIDLGKKLIDDYIQEVKSETPKSQATLSLIDLAEFKFSVPQQLKTFAQATGDLIESDEYKVVSDSRAKTKEFATSSRINQIDLLDFAKKLDTPEADAFTVALKKAIKYNRMSDNITNANGLSIYFPYGKLSDVSTAVDTYEEIGMDQDYTDAIKSFANLNVGGQMASQGGNILSMLLGNASSSPTAGQGIGSNVISSLINTFLSQGNFSAITGGTTGAPEWLDTEQLQSSAQYYSQNMIDPASFVITEKEGLRVLALSEKEWALVQKLELSVFIDDGAGFIDLGRDNVYEYNTDGDLILEYDGTWLTLNGHIISYYLTSYDAHDNAYTFMGRIPSMLNDERVDIIVSFDQDNPDGQVLGARKIYDATDETSNLAKGLIDIEVGDQIDFLCDYYSYEGDFNDTYFLGDALIFDGDWQIENLAISNLEYRMTYKITDIYGNSYWTPVISD